VRHSNQKAHRHVDAAHDKEQSNSTGGNTHPPTDVFQFRLKKGDQHGADASSSCEGAAPVGR
jgi:hypothetical protein